MFPLILLAVGAGYLLFKHGEKKKHAALYEYLADKWLVPGQVVRDGDNGWVFLSVTRGAAQGSVFEGTLFEGLSSSGRANETISELITYAVDSGNYVDFSISPDRQSIVVTEGEGRHPLNYELFTDSALGWPRKD